MRNWRRTFVRISLKYFILFSSNHFLASRFHFFQVSSSLLKIVLAQNGLKKKKEVLVVIS